LVGLPRFELGTFDPPDSPGHLRLDWPEGFDPVAARVIFEDWTLPRALLSIRTIDGMEEVEGSIPSSST